MPIWSLNSRLLILIIIAKIESSLDLLAFYMQVGASGQMVRALDFGAKHRWFEPNPRVIVGMLAHCQPSCKWVPGGNTGEVKCGEEMNWPPYLTMPAAQDKCSL